MSNQTQGQSDFSDWINNIDNILLAGLKQTGAAIFGTAPGVEQAIEQAKTQEGKNLLWSIFPIIMICGLTVFLIRAYK